MPAPAKGAIDASVQDIEWGDGEDPWADNSDAEGSDEDEELSQGLGAAPGGSHSGVADHDSGRAAAAADTAADPQTGLESVAESHESAYPTVTEAVGQPGLADAETGKEEKTEAADDVSKDLFGAKTGEEPPGADGETKVADGEEPKMETGEDLPDKDVDAVPGTPPPAGEEGDALPGTPPPAYEEGGSHHSDTPTSSAAAAQIVEAVAEEAVEVAEAAEPEGDGSQAASEESDGPELGGTAGCRKKVRKWYKQKKKGVTLVWAYWSEHHSYRMRCILVPLFCIFLPCILLLILRKAIKHCCHLLCRNKRQEEEEEEERLQMEEMNRRALALAAGPQRSKMKRPNQFARFSRQRNLQKDVSDDEEKPHGHAGKLQDARANLRGAAKEDKTPAHMRSNKRAKAGGSIVGGDIESAFWQEDIREPWYRRMNPLRFPGYFRDWWYFRIIYLKKVAALLDQIQEEEEFDWDNLDEQGNPTKNVFLMPTSVRRKYRWFIRLLPLFALMATFAWFGVSLWRNLSYVEGDCKVQKLPKAYETIGSIDEHVQATYIVTRYYVSTPVRPAGHVIQECKAVVPCSKMDYGATNSYSDDRCVTFQSWKLGESITCYYDSNDYIGDKGTELVCLDLPSKMERETFTVAIVLVLNILICVVVGVYRWSQSDLKRQGDLAQAEQEAQAAEEAAAKKMIEEKEAADALAQKESDSRFGNEAEEGADFLADEAIARDSGEW